MKNQKVINEIESALEHVEPINPSEDFLLRMENFSEAYVINGETISMRSILGIAASFALLVILNIGLLKGFNNSTIEATNSINESAYNLVPTKSIYNE